MNVATQQGRRASVQCLVDVHHLMCSEQYKSDDGAPQGIIPAVLVLSHGRLLRKQNNADLVGKKYPKNVQLFTVIGRN